MVPVTAVKMAATAPNTTIFVAIFLVVWLLLPMIIAPVGSSQFPSKRKAKREKMMGAGRICGGWNRRGCAASLARNFEGCRRTGRRSFWRGHSPPNRTRKASVSRKWRNRASADRTLVPETRPEGQPLPGADVGAFRQATGLGPKRSLSRVRDFGTEIP